ncbi:hypothetical protein FBY28_4321 [Arthrobacter sp. SLBN-53]|nr:hypothetical protein FBY28_4321 [Arthrobacter sp. SLBN-53]
MLVKSVIGRVRGGPPVRSSGREVLGTPLFDLRARRDGSGRSRRTHTDTAAIASDPSVSVRSYLALLTVRSCAWPVIRIRWRFCTAAKAAFTAATPPPLGWVLGGAAVSEATNDVATVSLESAAPSSPFGSTCNSFAMPTPNWPTLYLEPIARHGGAKTQNPGPNDNSRAHRPAAVPSAAATGDPESRASWPAETARIPPSAIVRIRSATCGLRSRGICSRSSTTPGTDSRPSARWRRCSLRTRQGNHGSGREEPKRDRRTVVLVGERSRAQPAGFTRESGPVARARRAQLHEWSESKAPTSREGASAAVELVGDTARYWSWRATLRRLRSKLRGIDRIGGFFGRVRH